MKAIRKFVFLSGREKKLFCQSFLFVAAIRLSLWIFPFRTLTRRLARFGRNEASAPQIDWSVINDVTRAVGVCSRFVPQATCLTQALATQTLLRIKRQNCDLKIGVDKDANNRLTAHAWIEVNGKIVIGKLPGHKRYKVLNQIRQAEV